MYAQNCKGQSVLLRHVASAYEHNWIPKPNMVKGGGSLHNCTLLGGNEAPCGGCASNASGRAHRRVL